MSVSRYSHVMMTMVWMMKDTSKFQPKVSENTHKSPHSILACLDCVLDKKAYFFKSSYVAGLCLVFTTISTMMTPLSHYCPPFPSFSSLKLYVDKNTSCSGGHTTGDDNLLHPVSSRWRLKCPARAPETKAAAPAEAVFLISPPY